MFDKQIRKMNLLDLALVKIGVLFFVLFILGIWPTLLNLFLDANPWYFLLSSIICVAIIQYRIWR